MSFPVYFYRADKKANSTKQYQLSEAALTIQNCTLKDTCSVVNPVLVINPSVLPIASQNVYSLNYCYIGLWGRFYFINDWIWNNGLWCATCSVDVLATYRGNILNSSLYVMRSSYDDNNNLVYDGNIADSKYPTTAAAATYIASAVNNPYAIDDSLNLNGVFVVGIVNSHSQNGAVTYYCFTMGGFLELCQALFNYSTGWLNIDVNEISEDLQKALINPFQYIVSCIYLPIGISEISTIAYTSTNTIYFGWWSVTLVSSARLVNSGMVLTKTNTLTIPRHPSAVTRGNYLNLSPYSIYTLRYYPYGAINIDSEAIASWTTLDLYSSIDIVTGRGVLDIAVNGRNNPIRSIEAQIGVQVPTASLQTSYQQLVTGKSGAIAAGAEVLGAVSKVHTEKPNPASYTGNFKGFLQYARDSVASQISDIKESVQASGGIKQIAADVMNTAIAASTTAEIQGMQGTGSLYQVQALSLSGRFLPVAAEDLEHTGRPLMQIRQLSTLRGFTLCKDGEIECNGTEREKQAIAAYLEGGFFIE